MAIKRFGDYEKTQAYGDYEALPKGGYVVKILGAELCSNSVGQYVKISCDIAEGEYAGFCLWKSPVGACKHVQGME